MRSALKLLIVACVAVSCHGAGAWAQTDESPDQASAMTTEQWKARIESAKARILKMRRDGESFVTPPDDVVKRLLEDRTLVYGDMVATDNGIFQFVGRTDGPHQPDDFRQVARDRSISPR